MAENSGTLDLIFHCTISRFKIFAFCTFRKSRIEEARDYTEHSISFSIFPRHYADVRRKIRDIWEVVRENFHSFWVGRPKEEVTKPAEDCQNTHT